jgi:hypothetical protein
MILSIVAIVKVSRRGRYECRGKDRLGFLRIPERVKSPKRGGLEKERQGTQNQESRIALLLCFSAVFFDFFWTEWPGIFSNTPGVKAHPWGDPVHWTSDKSSLFTVFWSASQNLGRSSGSLTTE